MTTQPIGSGIDKPTVIAVSVAALVWIGVAIEAFVLLAMR